MDNHLLEVALLGNPVLRQIANPIGSVLDKDVQTFFDRMTEALESHPSALAFAAPQFSVSLRCFVFRVIPHPLFPQRVLRPSTLVINPKIVHASGDLIKEQEACLSVPVIRGYVPRHHTILVEYTTRDNVEHTEELTGLLAKLFQHEIDHLDGFVFLDRLDSTRDIISEEEYQKILSQQVLAMIQ